MSSLTLFIQEYGHIGVMGLGLLMIGSLYTLEALTGVFFNFINFKFLRPVCVTQEELLRTDDNKKIFHGGPMYELRRSPNGETTRIRIPDFQAVQILRYEGQSIREIAATLGILENEVSSYIQRARIISEERQLR